LSLLIATLSWRSAARLETRANIHILESGPRTVLVGDFNGDGILDAATIGSVVEVGKAQILLGNGDGSFRAGPVYSFGFEPFYGATASLRRNGVLDLIVSDFGKDDIYVLLGNGDGTFQLNSR
jgi:hypothetical protein